MVEKYSDRFEFSNPGSLLISFDQLLRGNISECRNKTLQTIFMMIGTAEKAGSGVDKIRRGWETQHWRIPAVREQVQPDRVQWLLPMVSLIPEESLAKLTTAFGKRFTYCNALEVQALVTADVEYGVDNARMRHITGGHAADMTKILQSLVGKKMLIQEGQGRWSRYRLPPTPDSEHKEIDSEHKTIDSEHKEIESEQSEALLDIAEPARLKQRLLPQEMEAIVLDLCRGRWLTRNQLAELLDRHPDGLRQRFLNPMVTHGLLRLRYPDKPNRTDQAYTTNK